MNRKALPELFLNQTKILFGKFGMSDEYDRFLQSFEEEPRRGIRMNSLKIKTAVEAKEILTQMYAESLAESVSGGEPFNSRDSCSSENLCNSNGDDSCSSGAIPEPFGALKPIPWSDDGFYIPESFFPGRHPFYLAGLFYIQEPSAMLPANVLKARPGEHVLDLCAAPGGKTVKIAADMQGKGILIANDINETRVRALVRNVELAGCSNCIVLNESPEAIARRMPGYFDKILLDAPCSGEGMFRRDPSAMDSWEKFGNQTCVVMQREILSHVDALLKPGGILVYSTCTFSTLENEELIQWFLKENPWYEVLPIERSGGIHSGLSADPSLYLTARIFPHQSGGEGHFCAKLQKHPNHEDPKIDHDTNSGMISGMNHEMFLGMNSITNLGTNIGIQVKERKKDQRRKNQEKNLHDSEVIPFTKMDFIDAFQAFSKDVLTTECINKVMEDVAIHFQMIQGHVYILPEEIPSMDDLKIVKKGLYLGELKQAKGRMRFEPSHSFLLSRTRDDLRTPLSFDTDDPLLMKYLKGETLILPSGISGQTEDLLSTINPGQYAAICVEGYPIGWGKTMPGGMIKNCYPQGWRR